MAKSYTWKNRGRWYARIPYIDSQGKRRLKCRRAENKTDARQVAEALLVELRRSGARVFESSKMTFRELADHFRAEYAKPAQYVQKRKIAGYRSHRRVESMLSLLVIHFGDTPLRAIDYEALRAFKAARVSAPVMRLIAGQKEKQPTQRSMAAVNRELSLLRRMLNIAKRNHWITANPFNAGEPLISNAEENERMRILTEAESLRLLAACTDRRAHLKPIIIAALDTAMRAGELLKLRWRDVAFAKNIIYVEGFNTKIMRPRTVPITSRLHDELAELWEKSEKNLDALVFRYGSAGITDNIKKAFNGARSAALLDDVHFHDLRHTAITWMVQAGLPHAQIMKISGHTQMKTFLRYVNTDSDIAQTAAALLDAWQHRGEVEPETIN